MNTMTLSFPRETYKRRQSISVVLPLVHKFFAAQPLSNTIPCALIGLKTNKVRA
jgi:hypothetical protein